MRTPADVERSLKRYVNEALPEYEVRLAEEPGTFDRPFAMVSEGGELETQGRESRYHADVAGDYAIHVYPVPVANPIESKLAAYAARDAIWVALEEGVGLGWPRRVPLYDYDAVDWDEPAAGRPPRGEFARVLRHTERALGDPDDDSGLLWEVLASVRLGWRRRTRLPSGPVVTAVTARYRAQ